ncbi:OprO/OprP family phosphate-selective porin [Robertkochia solimangrovi]|uniref:OprO/OprP family phosphate-selective porin n=1 Tax=Robertkochia solimangrovi TaxID=2213046 RepID=UPI00117FD83F|nr:porin [Robertkochia solimangrovi]TRZ44292.1 porin [Robertkochia solimangrovi]
MRYILLFLIIFSTRAFYAQDSVTVEIQDQIRYNKGFEFTSKDGMYQLHLEGRLQFRFATPDDQNPLTYEDFNSGDKEVFKINRARLKIGGHAYQPWLKYYFEYELSQGNLLDFRIMIEKWPFLKFKIGQWKTYYGRERSISSGKQQMLERSIINRPFTLDRQQGVEVYGRVFPETSFDLTYHISILTGTGRGVTSNDDGHFMYAGRLQYNLFGRELDFIGSDTDFHDEFTGLIAVGAATNRGIYTRFSQSGGGQLSGYEDGEEDQYRIKQWMQESAFMYRGFSWQQELHFKEIYDHVNLTTRSLSGYYVQAGYFMNGLIHGIPEKMELAGRYARYQPDRNQDGLIEEEYSLAFNWFFSGHRNKLTIDYTWFNLENPALRDENKGRFRIQWDISF